MVVTDAVDAVYNNHKEMFTYQETNRGKSAPVGVDWMLIRTAKEPARQQRSFQRQARVDSGIDNGKRSATHNP